MSAVTTSRLTALLKLRSSIFQTAWNPTGIRTGAKYVRRKLVGPAMASYYPTRINLSRIVRKYPELEMVDEDELERQEDVAAKRKRGKGAPKKAKSKCTSGTTFSPCVIGLHLLFLLQPRVAGWARSGKHHLRHLSDTTSSLHVRKSAARRCLLVKCRFPPVHTTLCDILHTLSLQCNLFDASKVTAHGAMLSILSLASCTPPWRS